MTKITNIKTKVARIEFYLQSQKIQMVEGELTVEKIEGEWDCIHEANITILRGSLPPTIIYVEEIKKFYQRFSDNEPYCYRPVDGNFMSKIEVKGVIEND
ncbi:MULTISPECIES: hypothetical protein [unclassified Microcoleus]|uniref:hypothetical protein n=1 Tax=unclassified Microcoleus TaxID=2642155 RepID=UPI002FD5563B